MKSGKGLSTSLSPHWLSQIYIWTRPKYKVLYFDDISFLFPKWPNSKSSIISVWGQGRVSVCNKVAHLRKPYKGQKQSPHENLARHMTSLTRNWGGGSGTRGQLWSKSSNPEALTRNFPLSAGGPYMRSDSLCGSVTEENWKERATPIRWLHGPHRLHHHVKSSTVWSATRYEGTSGYVTPVNNSLVLNQPLNFNTWPAADLTICENDETKNCARPE